MWKRREEDHSQRQATPPTSAELAREGIPMSTIAARNTEPEGARGGALIGKSVVMKGQVYSREDLYIDGEVEGTVELQEHRLTIGPNGKVQAGIKAREVVVIGTVHGNIEAADKIDIRKDAKLVGDIRTSRIVIEDGAYFKGSIDISRTEVSKPAAPAPKPQGAAVTTGTPQQQTLATGSANPKP
ncbi:MAG TPA: polymer-forming cytoskeletal protein [Bryobacteraceae bacterium]|nr:polymer-forming cytoskeletal protein [Bryobacteraceae bacterium]